MSGRDWEREAIADAAYRAWSSGRNYDAAWDRAERAVDAACPYDRYEAEAIANAAAMRQPPRPEEQDEPPVEEWPRDDDSNAVTVDGVKP